MTRAQIKKLIARKVSKFGFGLTADLLSTLKFARADGAGAAADISVVDEAGVGIKTSAILLAVLEFEVNTAAIANHLDEASITAAGVIQLASTATTGDDLLVIYFD